MAIMMDSSIDSELAKQMCDKIDSLTADLVVASNASV